MYKLPYHRYMYKHLFTKLILRPICIYVLSPPRIPVSTLGMF